MVKPLCNSTGNQQVDHILQGVVGLFETFFPTFVRAYYVIGSYADGSMVPISDIDFTVVFAKPLTQPQLDQARALVEQCGLISPIRLDIGLTLEGQLSVIECTLLKLGSLLVYGEDLRDRLQLPPIELYQRTVTWSPYRFLGQVLRGQQVMVYPLTYPDIQDRFYGYCQKRIAAWYPAGIEQGTKELVTGIMRAATALLALRVGQYIGTKSASVRCYRTAIGDGWSDYLEQLYRYGKGEWHYQVPEQPRDQQRLRDLCAQTLAFENHYFAHYRAYLLNLLHGSEEDRCFAAERLTQVVYGDAEMIQTLRQNTQASQEAVRHAARQALAIIDTIPGSSP